MIHVYIIPICLTGAKYLLSANGKKCLRLKVLMKKKKEKSFDLSQRRLCFQTFSVYLKQDLSFLPLYYLHRLKSQNRLNEFIHFWQGGGRFLSKSGLGLESKTQPQNTEASTLKQSYLTNLLH